MDTTTSTSPTSRQAVVLVAWVVLLACSLLPVVVAQELLGLTMTADARAAGAIVAAVAGLALTLAWRPARALRPFIVVLIVLVGAQWVAHEWLDRLEPLRGWLADDSFGVYMVAEVVLNLAVTAAVVATLFALKRDRRSFYLARGDLSAPAGPIRWLRVRPGARWSTFGRDLTIIISLGTLAFLVIAGQPSAGLLSRALPFLPAILLAATLNAFNEEMSYKASLLSVLVEPVGARQALWMVAAYFGIAHYYGIPYGIVGVALAWFLGWILAKSMLETRGLGWAWFIHFVQDVLIFGFLAGGAIVPGGG
jgi:hypothetical protein